ncbi:nickel pincer cofactor biosynthesis protein LarB [Stieleria varia]|uniref:nickel pincer cofactor biosynthesis protein LarB n=1 Tax=Stieleria varia TaxID=2528005 RepID=UPI00313E9A46
MTSPADPPRTDDPALVLGRVAAGQMSVADALRRLGIDSTGDAGTRDAAIGDSAIGDSATGDSATGDSATRQLENATVDLGRSSRCGFAEVIYGEGKSADLIIRIISAQQTAGQSSLVTRIDPDTATEVLRSVPTAGAEEVLARHNPTARTLSVGVATANRPIPLNATPLSETSLDADGVSALPRHVAVVTAGSTDAPVAEEAMETLHWMGVPFSLITDIGVAGPQRLLQAVPRLRAASAIIVIAGMEGALPAAIGGHVRCVVFAVPTSVGYGATLGGLTPMLGMLSSCASNVAVVNIDAGFKAAYLAGITWQQLNAAAEESKS